VPRKTPPGAAAGEHLEGRAHGWLDGGPRWHRSRSLGTGLVQPHLGAGGGARAVDAVRGVADAVERELGDERALHEVAPHHAVASRLLAHAARALAERALEGEALDRDHPVERAREHAP